jgi:hypothetical protein
MTDDQRFLSELYQVAYRTCALHNIILTPIEETDNTSSWPTEEQPYRIMEPYTRTTNLFAARTKAWVHGPPTVLADARGNLSTIVSHLHSQTHSSYSRSPIAPLMPRPSILDHFGSGLLRSINHSQFLLSHKLVIALTWPRSALDTAS